MTDKTIARYDGPRTIDDLARYSQIMAEGATVLPAQYRRQPGAIAFAVEYAKALDVSPVTAITGIHVIDGKPTASAGLISALIRRAGHSLRVSLSGSIETGDLKATASLVRNDDPDHTYLSEWTIARAVRANLMKITPDGRAVAVKSGSAWDTYPESMLKARAITEVGRDGAEDVLLGVHYTPEELGADVDATGDVVYTVTQVPATAPQPREDRPQEPASSPPAPASSAPVVEPLDPVDVARVDKIRAELFAAQSVEDARDVWNRHNLTREVAETVNVGDGNGEATTLFALFAAIGKALGEGTRLVDHTAPEPDESGESGDVVDAEIVEDTTTDRPPSRSRILFDRLLDALSPEQADAALAWWQGWDLSPAFDDADAGRVVEAVANGTVPAIVKAPGERPAAEIAASIITGLVETPAERAEEAAKVAEAGPPRGRAARTAAQQQARAATAAAKEKRNEA